MQDAPKEPATSTNTGSKLAAPWRRLAYTARAIASANTTVYMPLARRRYGHIEDRLVGRDTELVIEGFQRSGNTFATVAFNLAQTRPVKLAHHLHAPAQIRMAVKLGVPCLVLIRDPIDTAVSQMIYESGVDARQALWSWIWFYRHVEASCDAVLIADFRDVSRDFGSLIREVNERFRTNFAEFEHSEENVQRVFALIDERTRSRYGTLREDRVPRPSRERAEQKRLVRQRVESKGLAHLRRHAYELYRALSRGPFRLTRSGVGTWVRPCSPNAGGPNTNSPDLS